MLKTAYLILSDGTYYRGLSFGAAPLTISSLLGCSPTYQKGLGEVVFNTSMTGYHEILTDPSYTGQMVLMTYPHIGNYGSMHIWSENGPDQRTDNGEIKAAGLIVRDYYEGPVPPGRETLEEFMIREQIPGITGIDTRRLTLSLRDEGSRNGIIVTAEKEQISEQEVSTVLQWLCGVPSMEGQNLVEDVGTQKVITIHEKGSFHMGLIDYGIKNSIIDKLVERDVRITLFPSDTTYEELTSVPIQALFLSNGPGDPAVLSSQIALIRACIGTLPIYGICLGHQLIAEALGAHTFKMPFGHHGGNHPVRDLLSGRVFVTAQNHGFAVDPTTIPEPVKVWFTNANDRSVEGLRHETLPIMSVQFHPEAAPGPDDGNRIFDTFLDQARTYVRTAGVACQQEQI